MAVAAVSSVEAALKEAEAHLKVEYCFYGCRLFQIIFLSDFEKDLHGLLQRKRERRCVLC